MGGQSRNQNRPYPPPSLATKVAGMSPPKFFSRFSKKLKYKFAGDGYKQGGSGTDIDGVSIAESKGDGDEAKVDLMGLPLLPGTQEPASDGGRRPELGVPGNGLCREGNETIVRGQVVPVNPPSQSDLGILRGDQGRSGGT